ncbi:hypothetical protein NT2_04_00530 [Caenibius tardaugens NBRC 16725]|uniref:Uncharacterized protein n=1 Tax=Caenibius tardaugens NBRC 16725 TaxID=1219035 RepID=U2YK45_9SPHN|nr:hypothetical protein [Caenibius tardaugens]AZI36250.1 hypothetical protein EGO55_10020 [Caenibius tardaugens NBRC 16725]GAD48642.1 hypothetical protein NT2_04_00530 [Caenibius tardaugens NBRC 16725]
MTLHSRPPHTDIPDQHAVLVDAARCWRTARDTGGAVQPTLFRLLRRRRADMLAPVIDSLMTLYEAALGRPVVMGDARALSRDERRLLGLFERSQGLGSAIACGDSRSIALACAISSTVIMINLAKIVPQGAFLG